jgi:hypothetical protein
MFDQSTVGYKLNCAQKFIQLDNLYSAACSEPTIRIVIWSIRVGLIFKGVDIRLSKGQQDREKRKER